MFPGYNLGVSLPADQGPRNLIETEGPPISRPSRSSKKLKVIQRPEFRPSPVTFRKQESTCGKQC